MRCCFRNRDALDRPIQRTSHEVPASEIEVATLDTFLDAGIDTHLVSTGDRINVVLTVQACSSLEASDPDAGLTVSSRTDIKRTTRYPRRRVSTNPPNRSVINVVGSGIGAMPGLAMSPPDDAHEP